jgi:glutamine cyclotransferase
MNRRPLLVIALACSIVGIALLWMARGDDDPTIAMTELAQSVTSTTTIIVTNDFPAIQDSAIRDPDQRTEPAPGAYTVVATIDHDADAFTQGFEFDGAELFESTGLRGQSTLREVDPATGVVLRSIDLPEDIFGEGLTIVGDEIIQLSWTSGIAYRWDVDTFDMLGTFSYEGQGWGICGDGANLIMSDGSANLTTRRVEDFAVLSTVEVTFNGAPVERLNELECVDGLVWANIWRTPLLIQIDPTDGTVLTVIDASALRPVSTAEDSGAVLNGIAYDEATNTYLLTGKRWPTTYRVILGGV